MKKYHSQNYYHDVQVLLRIYYLNNDYVIKHYTVITVGNFNREYVRRLFYYNCNREIKSIDVDYVEHVLTNDNAITSAITNGHIRMKQVKF